MNLLTVKQVAAKLSVAASYVWKLSNTDPSFPKPVRLGDPNGPLRARVTRWVDADVDSWILNNTHTKVLTSEQHTRTAEPADVPA